MINSELPDTTEGGLGSFLAKPGVKKMLRVLGGAALGAVAGWIYWTFIGCNMGTCPITSSPEKTILLFSGFGAWLTYKK